MQNDYYSGMYKKFLELASDEILILDLNGKVIEFSDIAAKMLGYSHEEMYGLHVSDWNKDQISYTRKNGSVHIAEVKASKINIEGEEFIYCIIGDVSDMVKQKKQDEYIELLQKRYKAMFHEHDAIMLLIDPKNGNIIDANKSAENFYGYSHDEFLALNIDQINMLPSQELVHLQEEAANVHLNHFIFTHKTKNGEMKKVEVSASPIETENGKFIFSIIQDITQTQEDQKKIERLSAQNELEKTRYKTLMEYASDAIHILDSKGNIVAYSRSFAKHLGYEYDEVQSLNVKDWDVAVPIEQLPDFIQELMQYSQTFETKYKRKDGTIIDVQINAKGVFLDGELYLYASARDITESNRLKKEILHERNFISTIIDNANAIIAVINADGVMIRLNEYGQKFTGYTQEEVSSEPYFFARFLNENIRDGVVAIIEKARKGEVTKTYQNTWISKTGEEHLFEWSNGLVMKEDGTLDYLFTIGIDISDTHKRKQEFQTIFETAKDGLAIVDLQSNLIEFNEAFQTMTGYTREELLKKSCIGMTVPEDISRAKEANLEVLSFGSKLNFEKSCINKSGAIYTINMSIALMPDKEHLLISAKDVTEDKKLRNELMQAENKFHTIFQESLDGIALLNPQTQQFFECNNQALQMYGYTQEEFLSIKPKDLDMLHDPEQIIKTQQHILEQGWDRFTTQHKTKEGTVLDVVVSARLLEMSNMPVIYVSFHDITEEKKLEEQLLQILSLSPIAVRIAKSDGHEVVFANKAYEKLLRLDTSGVIGKNPRDYYADPSVYDEIVQHVKNRETFYHKEIELSIKDETIWALCSYMPITYNSEDAVLGWFYDITEQKKLENSLKLAKEQAVYAANVKSEFLANMSHEIRTPLNGVTGLIELALKIERDDKVQEYLLKARQSSKALLNVINDILDFSKIEAGKLLIEHAPFILREMIDNIKAVFEFSMSSKSILFNLSIDSNIPNILVSDSFRITQIINNLLSNAVKFTDHGSISLHIKTVSRNDKYSKLQFTVTDTGIGMNSQTLSNLFQSFTQSDASTTRKYGGSGLGLAITKQLVELLGGEIMVESRLGKGSSFSFILDLEIADDKLQNELHSIHSDTLEQKFFSSKVLLVDDNDINLLVARELLEGFGLVVELARDGEEAVYKTKSDRFEMIFMDLHMPNMDGFEASKEIRKFDKDIVIIALSAAVMENDRKMAYAAGMNDHLAKPIDMRSLQNLLSKYLQGEESIKQITDNKQTKLSIPGIDLEYLLESFSIEMIEKFLKIFLATQREFCKELMKMPLQSTQFKNMIHTFKGISGNLAMTDIYALTIEIEKCDDGLRLTEMRDSLCKQITEVIEAVDKMFASKDEQRIRALTCKESVVVIDNVLDILNKNSLVDDNQLNDLISAVSAYTTQEIGDQLRNDIEAFEFKKAIIALQTIKEKIYE